MKPLQVFPALKSLFDDSNAKSPLNFKYVGVLNFMLSTIASWPHKQFGRRRLHFVLSLYNLLLITVAIALPSLGATYIWFKRTTISFFDMGHVVLCMVLDLLCLERLVLIRTTKYQEIVKDYILKFHLFYYKNRTQYAAKIFTQIETISKIFTIVGVCQLYSGLFLFLFMPWYNNYSRGMFRPDRPANSTFEQAVYFHCFTEDVYTTIKGYWILFILNIPFSFNTVNGIVIFNLLLCLIVFQIWGHLKILKHSLSSIAPKDGMFTPEENKRVKEILKENIIHHNLIVRFTDKFSNAFSEDLFVFYLAMQLMTCLCLLEVSSLTADALAKYGPLTIASHQYLIQVSILFEMINYKSEQLSDALYAMPWECMDTANRRTILLLLQQVQVPVAIKAAKIVPVGLQTMAGILKTTFSYFMILNAIAGDR